MLSGRRHFVVLAVSGLLAACAHAPSDNGQPPAKVEGVREYLDGQSGVTVTSMAKPLLFAHDRPERRAQLRDYVTVTAASVNRQGHRVYLLIAYLWSTLDARNEPARIVPDAVVVVADDHRIRMDSGGGSPESFGIVHPAGAPSGRTVKTLLLVTDLNTLGSIATAHTLQVRASEGDAPVDYALWDDQRKSLDGLVRYLNGER